MKKTEPLKTWAFIVLLVILACVVNGAHDFVLIRFAQESPRPDNRSYQPHVSTSPAREVPQPQYAQPQPVAERMTESSRPVEIARQKTPEELAAERAQFLARYMNARDGRSPGVQTVAIVAVGENGTLDSPLATVLADRVKGNGVKTLTSVFTPEFVSDGLFKDAFDGSPAPLARLELGEVLDTLLLARESIEYVENPALQNVLTARLKLEVMRVSVARRGEHKTWTFTANGPGFSQADARKAAEERLAKQLSNDTSIVISP